MEYRLEAVRNTKEGTHYSRRQNVLNDRFGYIATSLEYLPSGTVIDGEVGPNGHTDFYLLQRFRSAQSNIVYYAFDILVHEHRDRNHRGISMNRNIIFEDKGRPNALALYSNHRLVGYTNARRGDWPGC
jgi:hypothetical protein